MIISRIQGVMFEMSYIRFGSSGGTPFIIIPGLAIKSVIESAVFIEAQYKLLAEDYDIYVIDRRTDVPENYSINDMTDDTIKAIDALSIRNAALYGVSQGGMISQMIALKRPDIVSKLILCSTSAYIPENTAAFFSDLVRLAKNNDRTGLVLRFADMIYSNSYFEQNREVFIKFGESITDEELSRFEVMAGSFDDFDLRSEISGLRSPVLVICGEKDKIFDWKTSEEIASLTNGKLLKYPNEAHAVYDEEPDVISQIRSFLNHC